MLGLIFKIRTRSRTPPSSANWSWSSFGREQWLSMASDVKGNAHEGLLGRNAQGVKANVLFFDRTPGSGSAATKEVWYYDLRTNKHFTLKTRRMTRADLAEFVECYRPENRHLRQATWTESTPDGRWRCYPQEEIMARDKVSLDIFWLRDESLEDSANLPEPAILAQEIADDLRSALEDIEGILMDLPVRGPS